MAADPCRRAKVSKARAKKQRVRLKILQKEKERPAGLKVQKRWQTSGRVNGVEKHPEKKKKKVPAKTREQCLNGRDKDESPTQPTPKREANRGERGK